MRVFKIFDEDLDNKEIGILLHYDLQNEFIVELCDDVDEWQAPVLFSSFLGLAFYPQHLNLPMFLPLDVFSFYLQNTWCRT